MTLGLIDRYFKGGGEEAPPSGDAPPPGKGAPPGGESAKPPVGEEPVAPTNEPPKVEPPKVEPPKNGEPTNEPPKVEPPKNGEPTNEPPKVEPPKNEPDPSKIPDKEPPKVPDKDPSKQPPDKEPTKEPPKDEPPLPKPKTPAEVAVEIVKKHGGSMRKAMEELNAQGWDQLQMVEALEAAYKATGRDTAGWARAADGSIVLKSARVGPGAVNIIRPNGTFEFGMGEMVLDGKTGEIGVKNVVGADGQPVPMPGEAAPAAAPKPPDTKAPDTKAPEPKANQPKAPEPKAPEPTTPEPTKMSRAEQIEELAKDPDNGGKPVPKTRREAEVILDLVDQGKVKGPVRRPVKGDGHSGDFVDGNGQDWDVKAPRSREKINETIKDEAAAKGRKPPKIDPTRPRDGEFEVGKELASIRQQIAGGEKVIIDTKWLTPADLATLKQAVKDAGLEGEVIYHE